MARRRRDAPEDDGTPLERLLDFRLAEWLDVEGDGPPPESWRDAPEMWHHLRARKRWHAARRAWAEAHDTTVLRAFYMDQRDRRPRVSVEDGS